jgi:hypothetical protein
MNKIVISFTAILALHSLRYTFEYIHWTYCVRPIFFSFFTMESPTCRGLRNLSNSFGVSIGGTMHTVLALLANKSE